VKGKEIKEKKYGETTTNTSFKAHVELLNHARSHRRYIDVGAYELGAYEFIGQIMEVQRNFYGYERGRSIFLTIQYIPAAAGAVRMVEEGKGEKM